MILNIIAIVCIIGAAVYVGCALRDALIKPKSCCDNKENVCTRCDRENYR